MYLIYWKNKVGTAVAGLCDHLGVAYHICDDSDAPSDFDAYSFIIPSPGIPSSHPIYATGKVISELDFADQFLPEKFTKICITGTDGKSTTTWILYSILQKEYFGKKKIYLSGNFDVPYSETVHEILRSGEKKGIIVLEISSFMAYAIRTFQTDYSIFTNLKPDHLNWHHDLQEYLDAKMNLLHHTKKGIALHEQVLEFVRSQNLKIDVPKIARIFWVNSDLRDMTDGKIIRISNRKKYLLSETHFTGLHNALNILSATLVMTMMKICSKRTRLYLQSISWLPHRIEFVTEKEGVRFIDDSKSTSWQSLIAALTAFPKEKTILIAGWSDKGDAFDWLEEALVWLKYMVLIGATREILAQKSELAWVNSIFADDMDEAVRRAYQQAKWWDTILLSPGCASFWLFRDYLDRAHKFREAIDLLN
jgi:UDP-N-acetylmuramoylalanine--D-glutamate ligase